ncbi:retrovirus-related pol polyprotein from transposon TNT 1-94 [Tanacetum coccineum]
MLAPGNYVQWKYRIKRYIDTKPNNELIHYCLQNPPYKFKWTEKIVLVAEGSSETTTKGYMENYKNVSQDIQNQLNAEAGAIQIILTGIDNDIYSTVDACPNACEMWKAIERLKQGESINVQDLETNLYWEFGKFTSRGGESLESYYSRFYKMMNELSQELKTVSYHKLYDILKQHQNEVNEIRAERLARTANPLALVAQQQPVYHPQNHPTHNNQYSSSRSQQSTRNRGKAIVNSSAPIYDQEPATVTKDDEMSKEKEIDKLMALISLSFKKIYKPTNNNLRTSSNTSRANQDNSLRINRGTGYDNQRVVNVAGARENVGTQVVQKSGIQCYNCKEYRHVSRECQKPKRVKDAAYHKEKMLLCKQEEAGVQLNAEQADWKDDTDDESDDQELEAHYMYMAQIQEVTPDPVDNSGPIFDAEPLHKLVDIILFIVDSRCSKHMTGNIKLLTNFVEKFLGTVKFGNDQIAPILGYGDLVQGTITIKQGNDLLIGSRGTDLYSITLQDSPTPNIICLMAKATSSQAWLCHRHLSHLNFDTINLLSKNNIVNGLPKLKFVKDHLCSSCELGKAKRKSFHTKTTPSSKRRLQLLHMDLCGPMRVESINAKKRVLVIVDDYSRYTWTHFLRSKDETPKVLIDFLTLIQRGLHAQVRTIRTDKCTKFLNKTLHAYFVKEGIRHETSTTQTPEQNGVVERRNRTLVEAARTMLRAAKVPLDGENLDKINEKGDACIFVGYSTQSKAYRVFNKRTRIIVETIHVNFDELPLMASDHVTSEPVPQCSTTVLKQESLSPDPKRQENVPQVAETVTTSNELELLYSSMFNELLNGSTLVVSNSMFNELLNGSTLVVSKSSVLHAADATDKRQHQNITHSSTKTVVAVEPPLNIHTTP